MGLENNPAGVTLYADLAIMLANHGKNQDAEALVAALRKQLPSSVEATIAIGDFYFQQKHVDQALAEYQRGLDASPNSLDIQRRMQDLYLSANRIPMAIELDKKLMKEAPKDVTVQVDHGRVLLAQGKVSEAIVSLQKVTRDVADSAQAHYFLAMAYWQNEELGQANSSLLDALKVSPGLPIVMSALVRLNLIEKNFPAAENYARELVQKFPGNFADRQLLSQSLLGEGRVQEAEQQLLAAKQLAPNDALIRLSLAQVYIAEQKLPEADSEFDTALSIDSQNEAILEEWTKFVVGRKQAASALPRITEYVRANPEDAKGHVLLASLNENLENYSAAQGELERAIQIDPADVDAYLRLGNLSDRENQAELAIKYLEKAAQLKPNSAPLATMLGNHYLSQHNFEAARRCYTQALEVDPNFAIANANLAWVDAEENRELDVALTMAQKAKSTMPDLPSITDTLAWVMYKRGDYAAALPLLQDCTRKAPTSASFHYHFGAALLAAGHKAEAKKELELALRLNLRNSDAETARHELVMLN